MRQFVNAVTIHNPYTLLKHINIRKILLLGVKIMEELERPRGVKMISYIIFIKVNKPEAPESFTFYFI